MFPKVMSFDQNCLKFLIHIFSHACMNTKHMNFALGNNREEVYFGRISER